jgi:hypothetical protein
MANPRHGYNPLNPLSLHSENQYRPVIFETAAGKVWFKETVESIVEQSLKEGVEGGLKEGQEAILKAAVERATKEAGETAYEKAIKEGLGETAAEQAAKEAMQTAGKQTTKDTISKEVGEQLVKDTAKESSEEMSKKFLGKGLGVGLGSAVGVGVFALAGILGSQGLEDWMRSMSGLDCDEKALDAGYTAGDSDYTTFVEKCQGRAETRMTILGVSAILVGGGVLFLLLN